MPEKLHHSIDNGLPREKAGFGGGTLVCACTSRPVKVAVKGHVAHNHACVRRRPAAQLCVFVP